MSPELPHSSAALGVLGLLLLAPVFGFVAGALLLVSGNATAPRRARFPAEIVVAVMQGAALVFGFWRLHVQRRELAAHYAKIALGVLGQLEWVVVLAVWGSLAVALGIAAAAFAWATRQRRLGLDRAEHAGLPAVERAWFAYPGPDPWLLAGAVAVCAVALVRVRAAVVAYLVRPVEQPVSGWVRHLDHTGALLDARAVELCVALAGGMRKRWWIRVSSERCARRCRLPSSSGKPTSSSESSAFASHS